MSDIEKGTVQANSPQNAFKARTGGGIANPATLGLFSFASTTFILSMYNVNTRGITHSNAVVGMAVGCGGLAQLLAGMWEFPKGNTFGATAFSSYGAFWLSFALILIPGSGILDGYALESELNSALGIYLITWFIVTFMFFIASLRKTISFIALFGFLSLTFVVLAAGKFSGKNSVTVGGGALGIVTAMIAYYIGLAELLAAEQAAVIGLPTGVFKHD